MSIEVQASKKLPSMLLPIALRKKNIYCAAKANKLCSENML
jgi:hypothetical protein